MAYPPYRPQGRRNAPPSLNGEEPSLEELMAELVRNERQQAASDATERLFGRLAQQRRKIRGGADEP
jgi:hypothetical protein